MMGDVGWADLVEKERQKRLSTIDSDSAKIETRVKAEEAADAAKQGSADGGTKPVNEAGQ
jgi:fatty acid-binding protein DegV